jgi:predicted  nucleic acid-binding Zn-ribbon protein
MHEALRLLPAISDVFVSVPHGSVLSTGIFVLYGAVLLQGLFLYNRWLARREQELLAEAEAARAGAAQRAHSIETELGQVRTRLRELEPSERSHVREIRDLEKEREGLRRKLRDLAAREAQLRASAERSSDLEQEHRALEDLLDEALEDVSHKEAEISSLQDRLKRASKKQTGSSRSRDAERLARRMRTLYKNLAIDDRAIADIGALGDETLKLRAEEGLKRLADDPDTAAVRRKVGGLPPHLSIFELGFAGKGRIYYTRTDGSSYRVLAVGGKATQKTDLEYLSRL